jgi:hypothetical protein
MSVTTSTVGDNFARARQRKPHHDLLRMGLTGPGSALILKRRSIEAMASFKRKEHHCQFFILFYEVVTRVF